MVRKRQIPSFICQRLPFSKWMLMIWWSVRIWLSSFCVCIFVFKLNAFSRKLQVEWFWTGFCIENHWEAVSGPRESEWDSTSPLSSFAYLAFSRFVGESAFFPSAYRLISLLWFDEFVDNFSNRYSKVIFLRGITADCRIATNFCFSLLLFRPARFLYRLFAEFSSLNKQTGWVI